LLLVFFMTILSLSMLSAFMLVAGKWLGMNLGALGFLGKFISSIGDILGMLLTLFAALVGGGVFLSFANRIGEFSIRHIKYVPNRIINYFMSAIAGAFALVIIASGIGWVYEVTNPVNIYFIPAGIGALLGLLTAFKYKPRDKVGIGMVLYYASRTIFNALRSIEALIMVIVFVVWVGIGPFAGVLALSLHTVAALAKLYSEQVESILAGPIEAVKATGANRLQTIIYAVVPQIIPPYISFTMYRWDINVRMSTIIGFAGGGGIGFLLIQNINLLNYRAASTQMIAIALVVASMDYLSSRLRERTI